MFSVIVSSLQFWIHFEIRERTQGPSVYSCYNTKEKCDGSSVKEFINNYNVVKSVWCKKNKQHTQGRAGSEINPSHHGIFFFFDRKNTS